MIGKSPRVPRLAALLVLAASISCARPPAPASAPALAGTAWQLVKVQSSDGRTLTPDDRTKYTIEFGGGGRLDARIDCNRGRGTWTTTGPNQVQLALLALTREACPPGSLQDQIVRDWALVRSYAVKDGHLFLSLMADGGMYEFEPRLGDAGRP
jgi:para-nitrobenzyl esterase